MELTYVAIDAPLIVPPCTSHVVQQTAVALYLELQLVLERSMTRSRKGVQASKVQGGRDLRLDVAGRLMLGLYDVSRSEK